MNKKIFWGLLLIVFGLFYTLQQYIPESIARYFLNYQMLIMIIGLWNLLTKKKGVGISLLVVGAYLYVSEFFEEYFNMAFPIIILVSGVIVLGFGIFDMKSKTNKKGLKKDFVFKNKKEEKQKEEIEDAEEIKEK